MTKEEALEEIRRDEENKKELLEARHEHFLNGRRDLVKLVQKDIRTLNSHIEAIKEAYLKEEV